MQERKTSADKDVALNLQQPGPADCVRVKLEQIGIEERELESAISWARNIESEAAS